MKKIISLEKKKLRLRFRLHFALTLLVGGMLALVMAQAASAHGPRYSDWSAPVSPAPSSTRHSTIYNRRSLMMASACTSLLTVPEVSAALTCTSRSALAFMIHGARQ